MNRLETKKMKIYICTECGGKIPENKMITNRKLIKIYGEGCTYFGHLIDLDSRRF